MTKHFNRILIFFLLFVGAKSMLIAQTEKPPGAAIKKVSVSPTTQNPGRVLISIDPTGTLESSKFIVRRYINSANDTGFFEVTSLYYGNQNMICYDDTAHADLQAEWYDIVTIDTLTNTQSDPSASHKTIFIEPYKNDSCNLTQTLIWNNYLGVDGVSYNVTINEEAPNSIGRDTSFINQVEYNKKYTYKISGRKGAAFETFSNSIEISTLPLVAPDLTKFYIHEINNHGNLLTLKCRVDTLANLLQHILLFDNNGIFETVDSVPFSNQDTISLMHETTISDNNYVVSAINTCHNEADQTEMVKPLILTSSTIDYSVNFSWNRSFSENETYDIELIIDEEQTQIFNIQNTPEFQIDLNATEYTNNERFQFQVIATENGHLKSYSNIVEHNKEPNIKMHNAITPNRDGKNDDIGPIISNASIKTYIFLIYDKFGTLIYESSNWEDTNWNGTYKGIPVSEGGYLYYISLTTDLNKQIEKSGVIHVIYP